VARRSTFSRRTFLLGSGFAALEAACREPEARMARPPEAATGGVQRALEAALEAARKAGASYADARVVRRRYEQIKTREDHVTEVAYEESYGIGVRVLAGGAWGFAASADVVPDAAAAAARDAVAIARANLRASKRPVTLAPVPVYHDTWRTPGAVDPFAVPLAEKVEYLLSLWREARGVSGVKYGDAGLESFGDWKAFASSEGTVLEQEVTRIKPFFKVTAVDAASGAFESRRDELGPMQAGWEYVLRSTLKADARKIAEDSVERLRAPSVTPGAYDLVLAPSHLWLTIHESIGHPTELDRALGLEANFAGTSFATPDKLGKYQYASEIVDVYADKTTPGGLATVGYDDDGVKTQRWDLVKGGRFVGYQTTRDQAAWIGESASRGTSYAEDFKSVPFQRMPNVSLAPSPAARSLEDLVAATDRGILLTGDGSWSIDHQRYNFQFGSQMAYAIEGGKIAHVLRDVAYQASTPEFWKSCDLLGGAASFRLNGAVHDGKGEPQQSNAVSHGCPPARFRRVSVINPSSKRPGKAPT
jgi:TldD protein